jgi:hypothetical protein
LMPYDRTFRRAPSAGTSRYRSMAGRTGARYDFLADEANWS